MTSDSISTFKGLHENKNCFILSSGTSLKKLDLSPLKRRITIGLNRSFMIYPDTKYHCVMDDRLFKLYSKELDQTRYLFTLDGNPHGVKLKLLGAEGFSTDLEQGIYSGYTISYFALQIAAYMKFKNVFYLGLDLCNREGNTHFFGYDYRSENHEETEFPKMRRSFENIAKKMNELGVKVYNCSEISTLKCFEKITFKQALEF